MAGKEMYDGLEGKYIRVFTEKREFIGKYTGAYETYITLNPGTDPISFTNAVRSISRPQSEILEGMNSPETIKLIEETISGSNARIPLDKIVGILAIDLRAVKIDDEEIDDEDE